MVHRNRLQAVTTQAAGARKQAADLRLYLERLVVHLDETSLRATLRLMVREASCAVRRQEDLIALERLDGRDTAERMDRLRELRRVQEELASAYAARFDTEDNLTAEAHNNSITPATQPVSRSLAQFSPANLQAREADVGSIPSARLRTERSCAEQPATGDR